VSDGEPTDDGLATPVLLVAMPQVLDPFFHRSVVLLLHHDDEGSFGLIVNRTTGITLAEILDGMDIEWQGPRDALAYFGGPVQPQMGTVLTDALPAPADAPGDEAEETSTQILADVWMTQHIANLTALAGKPPAFFRLVLGYAGWGEEQLISEILRNDWLTVPVSRDLLIETPSDEMWERAVRAAGVDPEALPAWGPTNTAEETN
jgi:putative transcriptional regulator